MSPMLSATGLVKHFGPVKAVDGVSLSLAKGEVLGFLGPNGAGKTTTMKLLTGFLVPTAGEAEICGHNIASNAIAAKGRFGYLPEGAPAYAEMTPKQFLSFIADARGLTGNERAAALERAIESVHLGPVLDRAIDTLSKGFKRRVGLAQAILHNPDVLILDEPTDGLDPNQKHEVRKLIQDMAPEKGIIISTHVLEEVDAVCSRAVIIDKGKVVADGTPGELRARSRYHNAVTLSFADSIPEEAVEKLAALKGVTEVRPAGDGKAPRLRVFAKGGDSILDGVAGLLQQAKWAVSEIAVDEGRLDDVFRAVTSGEADSTEDTGHVGN